MEKHKIFDYFENQANSGEWNSLYNPQYPLSYPFIIRLQKALEFVKDIKGKTVLDLGCGTGVLIPFILEKGGSYIGLDNSPKMLGALREKFSEEINANKIMLICVEFENLTLDRKCDLVIGLGFIEYFDDPKAVILKINKLMPEKGQLILSYPNFKSLDYFILNLFVPVRFLVRKLLGKSTPQPPRQLWTLKRAKKMLYESGFENLEISNYNVNIFFYPFSRFFPKFCNRIAKKLEYSWLSKSSFFATGFLISARKKS